MKRTSPLLALGIACLATASFAQTNLSIGSGDGSLALAVRDNGSSGGDTGSYDPPGATAANTTIWQMGFGFYDGTNYENVSYSYSGENVLAAGTPTSPNAQNWSNTYAFDNTALTATLAIQFTQPDPGNTARATYTWTISNSSASPFNVRALWWWDGDNYIGSTYTTDLVGFTNGDLAIGQGKSNGSGGIDLDLGALLESSIAPSARLAIANGSGASFWFSGGAPFDTIGAADTQGAILPAYNQRFLKDGFAEPVVANNGDTNGDGIQDAGDDAGSAMNVNIVVPANGSAVWIATATWGVDTDILPNTSVPEWTMY